MGTLGGSSNTPSVVKVFMLSHCSCAVLWHRHCCAVQSAEQRQLMFSEECLKLYNVICIVFYCIVCVRS